MTADVIDLGTRVKEMRLPVWAQEELTELRHRLSEAEALVEAIVPPIDSDRTNTVLVGDEPVGLPHGTTVRFKVGLHAHSYVDVRAAGSAVVIDASRPLVVHPISSSALTVEVGR